MQMRVENRQNSGFRRLAALGKWATASMERLTERMAETNKKNPLNKERTRASERNASAAKANAKKTRWVQIRLFPIWLRIVIVLLLVVIAAALGAMIGYGVIGDGNAKDALKWETWQHIIDIMSGKK